MRIRPLTRTDIPTIAAINTTAFANDDLTTYIYPHISQYPTHAALYEMIRLRTRLAKPGLHAIVAETEDGDEIWTGQPTVVGHAFFYRYGSDDEVRRWGGDTVGMKLERALLAIEESYHLTFINRAISTHHLAQLYASNPVDIYQKIGTRWHMGLLAVAPECQRRGIGRLLVEYGQRLAEGENVPLTLVSSVVGRKLYVGCGFLGLGDLGLGEGEVDRVVMVWEPDGCKRGGGGLVGEMEDGWVVGEQ